MGNFLGDRNVLYLDGGDSYADVYICPTPWTISLKGLHLLYFFSLDKVDLMKTLPGKSPWKPNLRTTGLQFPKTRLHHFSLGLALTIRVRIFLSP